MEFCWRIAYSNSVGREILCPHNIYLRFSYFKFHFKTFQYIKKFVTERKPAKSHIAYIFATLVGNNPRYERKLLKPCHIKKIVSKIYATNDRSSIFRSDRLNCITIYSIVFLLLFKLYCFLIRYDLSNKTVHCTLMILYILIQIYLSDYWFSSRVYRYIGAYLV